MLALYIMLLPRRAASAAAARRCSFHAFTRATSRCGCRRRRHERAAPAARACDDARSACARMPLAVTPRTHNARKMRAATSAHADGMPSCARKSRAKSVATPLIRATPDATTLMILFCFDARQHAPPRRHALCAIIIIGKMMIIIIIIYYYTPVKPAADVLTIHIYYEDICAIYML